MSSCNIRLAAFAVLFLSCTPNSALEKNKDVWKTRLQDVDNLHMVKDIDAIHNLDDVIYMRGTVMKFSIHTTVRMAFTSCSLKEAECLWSSAIDGCTGWIVIQRNSHNTELTWSEAWTTDKYGFGDLEGDHWLGNKFINLITKQKWYKVRINSVDAPGRHKHAEYDSFVMKDKEDFYQLKLETYEGNAGDSLSSSRTKNMHDNMRFSADTNNYRTSLENCTDVSGGGQVV